MMELSKGIVFMALVLGVASQANPDPKLLFQFVQIDMNNILDWVCQNTPLTQTNLCRPNSKPTPAPTRSTNFPGETTLTTNTFTLPTTTPSSSSPSPLESAHWCRLINGTYLPLGYGFMYSSCILCQCTQFHDVRCTKLSCMDTMCIDNSTAATPTGECCPQCAYEKTSTCYYKGIKFPHGTILRTTSDNVKCWCQSGNVECRSSGASLFSYLNIWGDDAIIYVIIVVIVGILFMGLLVCCGCTFFYYYYLQQNPEVVQQIYDQCTANGGWQPVEEDGTIVDANGEQQATDEEKIEYDYTNGASEAYFAPPYALYNGSYVNDETKKDPNFM